jgi:hypothetical protein
MTNFGMGVSSFGVCFLITLAAQRLLVPLCPPRSQCRAGSGPRLEELMKIL